MQHIHCILLIIQNMYMFSKEESEKKEEGKKNLTVVPALLLVSTLFVQPLQKQGVEFNDIQGPFQP